MRVTRRRFFQCAGAATAGLALGPSIFANPLVQRAFAETIGDRYLVSLYLDGGNDGLNTIVPYDNAANPASSAQALRARYETARSATGSGGIRIQPVDVVRFPTPLIDLHTGCELGLHPGLVPLRSMVAAGEGSVAIVQGCGYPSPSLSHEESRTIWQTATPRSLPLGGPGWLARHIADEYQLGIPAATIDDVVAGELRGSGRAVLAVANGVERLIFPLFNDVPGDPALDALEALFADAASDAEPLGTIGLASGHTLSASVLFPTAAQEYLQTSTRAPAYTAFLRVGKALRDVAKIVYGAERGYLGESPPRFLQLAHEGFDTHANQGGANSSGRHYLLLDQVSEALRIFFDDLRTLGPGGADVRDKVLVLVWSEFGRRFPQNENGTDHGSQGPALLVGGPNVLQTGLYGNHPDIKGALDEGGGNGIYSQDDANGFRSTDFRDVYGTVLRHWVNVDAAALDALLPVDSASYSPVLWTAPNFDLPFF